MAYLKEVPFIIRGSVKAKPLFSNVMHFLAYEVCHVVSPPVMKMREMHFPLSFKAVVLKFWQKYYLLLTTGMGRNDSFDSVLMAVFEWRVER